MNPSNIFVKSLLCDKVKAPPVFLESNIEKHIEKYLKNKFEGVCSRHGYIKPGSIKIYKRSCGQILNVALNGDCEFEVYYFAEVCNPGKGSIIEAVVVNTIEKFGIYAHAGIQTGNLFVPVLNVIVPRAINSEDMQHVLKHVKNQDTIKVEVIGIKFKLGDKRIGIVGKMITANHTKKIVPKDLDDSEDESNDEIEESNKNNDTDISDDNESITSESSDSKIKKGEMSDTDPQSSDDDDEDEDDNDDDIDDDDDDVDDDNGSDGIDDIV